MAMELATSDLHFTSCVWPYAKEKKTNFSATHIDIESDMAGQATISGEGARKRS
jgi:hypothetical protein